MSPTAHGENLDADSSLNPLSLPAMSLVFHVLRSAFQFLHPPLEGGKAPCFFSSQPSSLSWFGNGLILRPVNLSLSYLVFFIFF